MTTPDFRALCSELIDALDSGITAERIRMSPLADRARAALAAEPEPVGPNDFVSELVSQCHPLDPEMAECLTPQARWRLYGDEAEPKPDTEESSAAQFAVPTNDELFDLTRAIQERELIATLLQQLSAPDPVVVPIPLSERLPGEGDCDAEGKCWLLHADKIGLLEWHFLDRYPSLNSYNCYGYTHWLPAHAIPIPQVGEVEP